MDITKLNLTELQALAYKQMVEIQRINNNLALLQQEIAKREEEEKNGSNQKNKD